MKKLRTCLISTTLVGIAATLAPPVAMADGMKPETSVVIIYEEDGEATMRITNTDSSPALLHTSIQHIPEDKDTTVVVTPPVARVEGGADQMVRFIYQGPALQTQRLKRVTFEGVGASRKADGRSSIGMNVRQNLPVLLHPKGLARNNAPWELLEWSVSGDQLTVRNDSAYVVRMGAQVELLPSKATADLQRTYVLPGETLTVKATGVTGAEQNVLFQPATVYGAATAPYEAPIK